MVLGLCPPPEYWKFFCAAWRVVMVVVNEDAFGGRPGSKRACSAQRRLLPLRAPHVLARHHTLVAMPS